MSSQPVSFFTPIKFGRQPVSLLQKTTEIVDAYFHLGGQVADVIPWQNSDGSRNVKLHAGETIWWHSILKVTSYMASFLNLIVVTRFSGVTNNRRVVQFQMILICFPALILISKIILRSIYHFHIPQQFGRFSVVEVNSNDWPSVIKTAEAWNLIAQDKYLRVHNGKYPHIRSRSDAALDPGSIFQTSINMINSIKRGLSNPGKEQNLGEEPWDSVVVCIDGSDKTQAIALFEKNGLKLAYLATHPDNIGHKINEDITNKVRGAGSAIILTLAQLALRANKSIYTRATNDAVGFYAKCGFEKTTDWSRDDDGYCGITPMKLTQENISRHISEKNPPFDLISSTS